MIWIKRREEGMKENKEEQTTSISKARTLEEIADFWDTHSLADYWDETPEVDFEVRIQRKCRINAYARNLRKDPNRGTGARHLTRNPC